ncbi:MAG: riboflavin synthase, partial [Acidimicrobiia bacterium]|nr:riboflavin synthase [Acidimicrobiia bacterium]
LRRTNLGRLEADSLVNLERAMPAGGRFDGHIVQGHIDMAGSVTAVEPDGNGVRVRIECGSGFMRHVVEKGSITVNGVSLTVSGVDESGFEFALIPHTLEVTTFGSVSVGDIVNLEADILAKYVERLLRIE